MLSTWMKGKSSPTAKLESQLTVPAIMNAAGLCDCWKNSPVRTKGIPPETWSNKTVILIKSAEMNKPPDTHLHDQHCSAALCRASETELLKSYFREATILSFMPSHLLFYILFRGDKQVTEQWIHITSFRAPCDELFIKNKNYCFY